VISSLIKDGVKKENIVLVSGIGCSSKIIDYINLNSFSSLHGRPVVSAEGIKLGNPDLKVIVCAGDGGTYNEGISHLIHAAKRNIDIFYKEKRPVYEEALLGKLNPSKRNRKINLKKIIKE